MAAWMHRRIGMSSARAAARADVPGGAHCVTARRVLRRA